MKFPSKAIAVYSESFSRGRDVSSVGLKRGDDEISVGVRAELLARHTSNHSEFCDLSKLGWRDRRSCHAVPRRFSSACALPGQSEFACNLQAQPDGRLAVLGLFFLR